MACIGTWLFCYMCHLIWPNVLACICQRLVLVFGHINWLNLANMVVSLSIFIYVSISLLIWSWYAW
ncbi:hypothetical protein F383_31948 [Gossypium arboreum]|uniref:Uncharacterized protein n=1 Tax=Gossypium arboreum TaxID=29729 RepID=A0A0B0NZ41_GOSAR|nr:hypothetical protein F383_03132 [Gossypium arboreum]KHG25898.1 hypothetical protein F383_31948 [Gossypium arboreum]